jgi:predicted ATPase
MLSKIRIKNFKCLKDTNEINIRPLTIFVGPNSSGKSSIIKMLLMLKQTIVSPDSNNPLIANGNLVEVGLYPDFVYNGEYDRDLEIYFDIIHQSPIKNKKENLIKKISVHSVIYYNPRTAQIKLKESEVISSSSSQKITLNNSKRSYSLQLSHFERGKEKTFLNKPVVPSKFCDIASINKLRESEIRELVTLLKPTDIVGFGKIIEETIKKIYYLGPLRDTPRRIYAPRGETFDDVGLNGNRTIDAFWLSQHSSIERLKKLEMFTEKWIQKFEFASDIHLERLSKGKSLFKKGTSYYRVELSNFHSGYNSDLADFGFGVSQVLPIIIESFFVPSSSLVMIEQPEIHLHPKAQAILADLFIDAMRETKNQFIIETHSEHILARIRRRIAGKELKKEDVAIYYFEPTKNGTKIQEITLNDLGQYVNFPKGFFEEDLEESYEHMREIKKNFEK